MFRADTADERDGVIHFRSSNGMAHAGRILHATPNECFTVEHFDGSHAKFDV